MRGQLAAVLIVLCFGSLPTTVNAAKDADLKSVLTKLGGASQDESFSESKLGKQWVVNKGTWLVQDGVVVGREKKEDMHAAVLTLQHPHSNSIIRFSFRLDGATGFNLSLNHAKGHLFRIGFNPTGVVVTKDKDEKNPESKPLVLGKAPAAFKPGEWYTVLIESKGRKVGVVSDNGVKLEVQDPSLAVEKTGYRFVIRGETISLDDVHVWNTEGK